MKEDLPQSWLSRSRRHLPYLGLAVSAVLACAIGPRTALRLTAVLGLSALAALWHRLMCVPHSEAERRPVKAVVFYLGLLVQIGALVTLSPTFGFFGFTGYLHVAVVPKPLRPAGIVVIAALMATTQIGGTGNLHGPLIAIYAALVVVNIVIAGAVTYESIEEDRRGRQRAEDLDALAEANRRLREIMAENSGLHAQLLTQAREAGVLDERQRMAGEIHDTLAQGLTGIVTQLEAAERFDGDPERRTRHREQALRLARESLAEARRSVQALRPGPLVEAQLPEAVADLVDRWSHVSGVTVRVEVTGSPAPLPPASEVVLFRVAQEGLANIAKHAQASRAGLTLSYTHEVVMLDVLDDGVGFATPSGNGEGVRPDSYGLTAMRQRLHQVGGTLQIESTPGEGTALSACVPALRAQPAHAPGDNGA